MIRTQVESSARVPRDCSFSSASFAGNRIRGGRGAHPAVSSKNACARDLLEQGTADLHDGTGVGERLQREGLVHSGIYLRFQREDSPHRLQGSCRTGRGVAMYPQNKPCSPISSTRGLSANGPVFCECRGCELARLSMKPSGRRPSDDPFQPQRIKIKKWSCDFIAGCDGFHGVSPPPHPGGCADDLRPRLSVRMAWHFGRSAAFIGRN